MKMKDFIISKGLWEEWQQVFKNEWKSYQKEYQTKYRIENADKLKARHKIPYETPEGRAKKRREELGIELK